MKILIIGGTAFIGPQVVKQLYEKGHEIAVFNRGKRKTQLSEGIKRITGDRKDLIQFREKFKMFKPEVVLDMIPLREEDARDVIETFKGIALRVVAISSMDVYRAYGKLIGTEKCDIQATPLKENSPLRQNLYPYRGKIERLDNYEKILVEKIVLNEPELPGTILRLPMVYGPGDYQHRLFSYLKRMDDGRQIILLDKGLYMWRDTMGYVEDVAKAIVLAIESQKASEQIYNVGAGECLTQGEWVKQIAEVVGWKGRVIPVDPENLPDELKSGMETAQHLNADTSKIRIELGFKETFSLRDAIERTVEWERANPPKNAEKDVDYKLEDSVIAKLEKKD